MKQHELAGLAQNVPQVPPRLPAHHDGMQVHASCESQGLRQLRTRVGSLHAECGAHCMLGPRLNVNPPTDALRAKVPIQVHALTFARLGCT
jgi:hypothetical protein